MLPVSRRDRIKPMNMNIIKTYISLTNVFQHRKQYSGTSIDRVSINRTHSSENLKITMAWLVCIVITFYIMYIIYDIDKRINDILNDNNMKLFHTKKSKTDNLLNIICTDV